MFLIRIIPVALLLSLALSGAKLQAQQDRGSSQPNVIIIICDDLNDAIHGMGGHPQALTPNIDALAQQGVRFTNAQCNAPVCGPSRASLWSGLYPHTTGYFGYDQQNNHWRKNPVLSNTVTLCEHFIRNGYQVYGTGKLHHNGHEDKSVYINQDGVDGFRVRPSFGPYPWDGDPEKKSWRIRGAWHPDYPEIMGRDYQWYNLIGPVKDISYAYDGKGSWLYDHLGKEYHIDQQGNRDPMPDEACTDYVLSVLKQNHKKPFLIAIGYNKPHTAWCVPQEFYDLYGLDTLILSPSLPNDLDDCAPMSFAASDVIGVSVGKAKYGHFKNTGGRSLVKEWTRAYLACVSFVDAQVGKVLSGLRNSPYAENTIIIFTSDHGYHMGEKGLIFKNTLWEESTRVPFVVSGPDIASGKECNTPVSLVDIYPTLLDYCSLPLSPNSGGNGKELDGFSIVPLLKNPEKGTWDGPGIAVTAVHSMQQLDVDQPGPVDQQHYSVRSERYRYILYRNGEEELYDQKYDPYEWFNLASDPMYAETRQELKAELLRILKSE